MLSDKKKLHFYKELLLFYDSFGVSSALSETPVNRFLEQKDKTTKKPVVPSPEATDIKTQKISERSSVPPRVQQISTHIPNDTEIANSRETAHKAETLEQLKHLLENFDGCSLKFTAKNTCFSDGTPGSTLMIIGEAPGREEDIAARPFVGRSGQLLDLMLSAIGIQRQQVYIANTIPWRPPGNRSPTPIEIELCRPFINRQIELASPEILIALGGPAARFLTREKTGILKLRGRWHSFRTSSGIEIPVMPTLHPAYLLRTPSQKKFAWNDFLMVKMQLENIRKENLI